MSLSPVSNNPFSRYVSSPLMNRFTISSRTAVTVSVLALGILAACIVIPLVRFFMHRNVTPLAGDKLITDDPKPSLTNPHKQFTGLPNQALQEALSHLAIHGLDFKSLKNHMSQALLQKVTELHLEKTNVTPQQLKDLALLLPNIKKLNLTDCGITNAHLQQLKEFKKLEDLNVSRIHNRKSPSLQDKDLEVFGQMLQLKWVTISGNDAITGSSFTFLPAHVTSLAAANCDIEDNSLTNLAHLKLRIISLTNNKRITGKTIDTLAKTLSMMLINGTSIDESVLETIKKFPELIRLGLPDSFKGKELGLPEKVSMIWSK